MRAHRHIHTRNAELVKDPICGMDVEPVNAAARAQGKDGVLYFCSLRCRDKFLANPEQPLKR
jgi:Cu+-exporting ATPase